MINCLFFLIYFPHHFHYFLEHTYQLFWNPRLLTPAAQAPLIRFLLHFFPNWLSVVFWFSSVYPVTSESPAGHAEEDTAGVFTRKHSPWLWPAERTGARQPGPGPWAEPSLCSAWTSLWPGPNDEAPGNTLRTSAYLRGPPPLRFQSLLPSLLPRPSDTFRQFTFVFYPALLAALGLACELTARKENCTGYFCFGIPCSLQDLSSLSRDQTCAPAVEAQYPNHQGGSSVMGIFKGDRWEVDLLSRASGAFNILIAFTQSFPYQSGSVGLCWWQTAHHLGSLAETASFSLYLWISEVEHLCKGSSSFHLYWVWQLSVTRWSLAERFALQIIFDDNIAIPLFLRKHIPRCFGFQTVCHRVFGASVDTAGSGSTFECDLDPCTASGERCSQPPLPTPTHAESCSLSTLLLAVFLTPPFGGLPRWLRW